MLIADTTSLEDTNRLERLSLKWTINGSTTFFWKMLMFSGEISIPAVFSRFSASSNNSSTQFAAGNTVSSSAQRVKLTKLGISSKLRCSVWSVLRLVGECNQECT